MPFVGSIFAAATRCGCGIEISGAETIPARTTVLGDRGFTNLLYEQDCRPQYSGDHLLARCRCRRPEQ